MARASVPVNTASTFRNIIRISLGGKALRVQFTNEFGVLPLKLEEAHVGIIGGKGAVRPGTDHVLTFEGRPSAMIPAGGVIFSDSVPMDVKAMSSVAISEYIPLQEIAIASCHMMASSTNYFTAGDAVSASSTEGWRRWEAWCFLKAVDVLRAKTSAALVTLGDSITDGEKSGTDQNHRWPDLLLERLQGNPKTRNIAVLNAGINGNSLMSHGAGSNAIARFDRDVIGMSGVKYLLILEGINDLKYPPGPREEDRPASAEYLIMGFKQLITRAHQHGLKVFLATLTPYQGGPYFTECGEKVRQSVNSWIRSCKGADGVIDFDEAMRDPSNPTRLLPRFDSGDHLHPNDAGYATMSRTVDLSLFR